MKRSAMIYRASSLLLILMMVGWGCSSRKSQKKAMTEPAHSATWPFQSPKNLAVITTKSIVHGGKLILLVSHDEADGGWQFLDGTEPTQEDATVVSLQSIVQRDPSVATLSDLPLGWQAWRASPTSSWKRSRHS